MPSSSTTYKLIAAWFLITAPVIAWDASYCFFRPRSFKGGDLHWIWKPYAIYQDVDYVYGVRTYEEGHGFTNAQSFMNVIETLLNLAYVYLAHVRQWEPASIVGFSAALMTLSKTVLYWLQEHYCGWCMIGHNSPLNLFILWIIPNGLWIVFPAIIVYILGKDIVASLSVAASAKQAAAANANGHTNGRAANGNGYVSEKKYNGNGVTHH